MSATLDLMVHKYRKNADGRLVLARANPYWTATQGGVRFSAQNGMVFDAGGVLVEDKDIPQWFWEAYAKLSPERQAKFKLKIPKVAAAEDETDKTKKKAN
jgi:hypothetical protein